MLEESIRWLISNGKVETAKRILRKATRWNGVDYKPTEEIMDQCVQAPSVESDRSDSSDTEMDTFGNKKESLLGEEKPKPDNVEKCSKTVEKYTVVDILKNPALRVNTIILWYSW
jgi:hypothetical protein